MLTQKLKLSNFKLVIATTSKPVYEKALNTLLNSLSYLAHIDEIVVVVSGVPHELHHSIQLHYQTAFGLKATNVLTYPQNMFEYASFVAVAENQQLMQDNPYFVFIHDTTKAGPAFWRDLYTILIDIERPRIEKIGEDLYSLSKPLRIADTYIASFKLLSDGWLASTEYQSVYLSSGWSMVLEKDDALFFEFNSSAADIEARLNEGNKIWFPFADNFNMGIATREFLRHYIHPRFLKTEMTKEEAIQIELNLDHPLNFKTLAKRKWQYATRRFGRIMSPEPWKNNHDIYGDGILRCMCGLVVPDLIKFVRLAE
jgi:hypothetical protein